MTFFEQLSEHDDRRYFAWLFPTIHTDHLKTKPIGYVWLEHAHMRQVVEQTYPDVIEKIVSEGLGFLGQDLTYSQRHAEAVAERFPSDIRPHVLRACERRQDSKAYHHAIVWLTSLGKDVTYLTKEWHQECPLAV